MSTECCCNINKLQMPNEDYLYPGNIISIGRYSATKWKLNFGWFTFDGNRKICGWFLVNQTDTSIIKPLQYPDLYDIYLIEA